MAKKDLANVTTDLSALAGGLPTQRSAKATRSARASSEEEVLQFSLSLRKSLRKQILMRAAETDMTMRGFILNALKDKGIDVRDDDLADLRKR